jgi:hypothetical protein
MGKLIDFYLGKDVHPDGLTIEQVWGWNDQQLEFQHTYIQWLFPSEFPSQAVPGSPVITSEEVHQFKTDPELRRRFEQSFSVMLGFYGFYIDNGKVVRMDHFAHKIRNWLTPSNHNFLRITRILKCLMLFSYSKKARAFYDALLQVYHEHPLVIGEQTLSYWHRACGAWAGT